MTMALLPEVQPVHSQNSVPSIQASVVRQKLTIAWWRSADSALITTACRTSSSAALIFVLPITPPFQQQVARRAAPTHV